MAKPRLHTVSVLRLRAFIDTALHGFIGRRLFTTVLTDNALRDSITDARRHSGYKGVVSKSVARNAAAARKALHN